MRRTLAAVAVATAAALPACRPATVPGAAPRTGTSGARPPVPVVAEAPRLVVVRRGGPAPGTRLPVVTVDVVSRDADRRRGLGGRERVEPGEGMLFVYARPEVRNFWMKDCPFALDIAFLDAEGRVVRLATLGPGTGVPDPEIPRADSGLPVLYVLETAGGWLRGRGIREGDRIDVGPAAAGVVAE